jgi:hypothetical protein
MRNQAKNREAKRDIGIRKHFIERSFAEATRYGFKRAWWRGRRRVAIQDYLVDVVQNVRILIAQGYKPKRAQGSTWPADGLRGMSLLLEKLIKYAPFYTRCLCYNMSSDPVDF